MNRRTVTIAVAAIGLLAAAVCAYNGPFKYDSKGRRDPFVPLVGPDRSKVCRIQDITSIDDVSLAGTAIGANRQKLVIINGEMLRENDKAGELKVLKITNKTVTLLLGGQEHMLNLPEEGGLEK